jgi:hypothetical protein
MYQYHILIHPQLEDSTICAIYFGSCKLGNVNGSRNWQSIITSEDIGSIKYDDNPKSSRGARFQANHVNDGLWVIDEAPGKTPKALRGQHVQDLRLIKPRIDLCLGELSFLVQRYIASSVLLILPDGISARYIAVKISGTHRNSWSDKLWLYLSILIPYCSGFRRVVDARGLIRMWKGDVLRRRPESVNDMTTSD